jgi:hypothetical protein
MVHQKPQPQRQGRGPVLKKGQKIGRQRTPAIDPLKAILKGSSASDKKDAVKPVCFVDLCFLDSSPAAEEDQARGPV